MDNKGFTLIELLSSIVILAIILALAIPSISSVSNAIKTSQRKNLIEKIEIASSKYAFDTNETTIFVDTLVKEGYIESDNDEGDIIDPLTNKRINCYIVTMQKKSDYYTAKVQEDKNYDEDGICNISKLEGINSSININVTGNKVGEWYSGEISLQAVGVDCSNTNNKCTWTSNKGTNQSGSNLTINSTSLLEAKYTFLLRSIDSQNGEIKEDKKSVNLKIDNESPTIYENELHITDKYIWTDNKKITVVASDGKGSGIAGYYMGIYNSQTCNSNGLSYQTSNVFDNINTNGTYLVCVKDKVGNTSGINININYIK